MAALILRQLEPAPEVTEIALAPPGTISARRPVGLFLIALGPSICSQRVRLTLLEKQLEFDEYTLNLWAGENLEPWYLDLNPRGVVPTLVESGRPIIDSATTIRYVDNQFEGPTLLPLDDARRAEAIDLIGRADVFPIRDLAYRAVRNRSRHRDDSWRAAMRNNVLDYRERYPDYRELYDLKLADFDSMASTVADPASMEAVVAVLERAMDDLDSRLADSRWLAGDELTLADIAWIPILVRLHGDVGIEVHTPTRRANLNRYVEQWEKRGSYAHGIERSAAFLDRLGDTVPPPPSIPGIRHRAVED